MFTHLRRFQTQALIALVAIMPAAAQSSRLSLSKIERLIATRVPDSVVAREIQTRGLETAPTKATLETLRQRGAGPATLAAVRALIWMGGHLNLEVVPEDARVEITGPDGRRYQAAPDLALGVGRYVLRTTKSNFQTDTRTVIVEDGQRTNVSIRLAPDQDYLRRMEQQLQQKVRYNDAMTGIRAAKELLVLDPGNVAARGYLASAHWKGFHGEAFGAAARDALRAGASVRMPLFHEEHHRGRTTTFRHEVEVAVMPAGFLFDPGMTAALSCSLRRMEIPYAALSEVKVQQTAEGEPYLVVKAALREQPGEFIVMKMFRTKTTPEKPGVRSNQFNRLAADAPPESAPIDMFDGLRDLIQEKRGLPAEGPSAAPKPVAAQPGTPAKGEPTEPAAPRGTRLAILDIKFTGFGMGGFRAKFQEVLKGQSEAMGRYHVLTTNVDPPQSEKPFWGEVARWGKQAGVDFVIHGWGTLETRNRPEWMYRDHQATFMVKVYLVDVEKGTVRKQVSINQQARGDTPEAALEALLRKVEKESRTLFE